MRSVAEWIGKTDDAKIPERVRVRIFLRHDGICHLSGRKIRPSDKYEFDHIIALCNGGEHRETNMAPALVAPHKVKTKADRALKAKDDRVRKKHLGIKKPSIFPGSRNSKYRKKIDGTVVLRNILTAG